VSNRLKMAMIETILLLSARGWSTRRIALELDIHRETVARYLAEAHSAAKPAKAPTGSENTESEAKPAKAPTGSNQPQAPVETRPLVPGNRSLCEPFRAVIETKLDQGLSAQRIFQDLVSEHNFPGSYPSVRRFVHQHHPQQQLPFRRMECGPGEEAQIDFGQGAPIQDPNSRRYRPHVLRVVLSYSRKAYSEVVQRQTTESLVRALENAFWYFGGVPQRLVLDNLRAAVTKADWYDPELNPRFRSFAQHYGIALMPTKPYTPRHKGKVERGVDYVQENALKSRLFTSLAEQNTFLLTWEKTVADTRIHGTTRQQVSKLFNDVERALLKPLPPERFPSFHEGQRQVSRDGHVEVARAYYSVPPEYLKRSVWVRWDGRLVRIFSDKMKLIVTHVQNAPGQFSTLREHISERKISGAERGVNWQMGKVRSLGPQCARWAEAMLKERGVEGSRVLQGLLALAGQHRVAELEHVCDIAMSHGAYQLRTLRTLLSQREAVSDETVSFLEKHELIRELSTYEQFVRDALDKEVQ
jgi:transposase